VSEHGDLIRLILTHDRFTGKPKKNADCRFEDISSEHGDLTAKIIELDGLNLVTLFGETDDLNNIDNDSDEFKYCDLFDANGEVYADTLWSSPEHRDLLVRDEHGCLMFVFDVYTVSIINFPYGPLTTMSATPPYPHGARPKDTTPAPRVRYACVAGEFEDFKNAHSLRRHMVQVHNLACDTLVQGRPFPHFGYVMKQPNAREQYNFPCIVFPDDWAVSHHAHIDLKLCLTMPHSAIDSWECGLIAGACPSAMPTDPTPSFDK